LVAVFLPSGQEARFTLAALTLIAKLTRIKKEVESMLMGM
jgi:hypothetical protein